MTEIPNPIFHVLELAEPGEIDQPKPTEDVAAFTSIGLVPVTEPCERCGCYWIGDPEAFVPEGNAECAYCRMWRGSIHRDASLSEFAEDSSTPSIDGEGGPQGGTIEAVMVRGIPVYDPEAMGLESEDGVGVVDAVREEGNIDL